MEIRLPFFRNLTPNNVWHSDSGRNPACGINFFYPKDGKLKRVGGCGRRTRRMGCGLHEKEKWTGFNSTSAHVNSSSIYCHSIQFFLHDYRKRRVSGGWGVQAIIFVSFLFFLYEVEEVKEQAVSAEWLREREMELWLDAINNNAVVSFNSFFCNCI